MSQVEAKSAARSGAWGRAQLLWVGFILAIVVLAIALPVWPEGWIHPLPEAITRLFAVFSAEAKAVTRVFGEPLELPLVLIEALLYRGVRSIGAPPLPWIVLLFGAVLLAHWAGGVRSALLTALAAFYLVTFGLWTDSMKTLALVIEIVPLAALLACMLGLWASSSPAVERVVNTILDVM